MSLGKTLNAVSYFGAKQSTVVVAQPDERHANRAASVLEWYDTTRFLRFGNFTAFFSKNCAFLGIFWPKFLPKNSFYKCLNKVY